MKDLEKRLKSISISKKNQSIEVEQMNTNDKKDYKLEERNNFH
jgi:hypothetical protein